MPVRTAGVAIACLLWLGACRFELRGANVEVPDGGSALEDLATVGDGITPPGDMPLLCADGGPTSACSGDGLALLVCQGGTPMPTPCVDGCSTEGGPPHCARLDPSGSVTPDVYEQGPLGDTSISGTAVLNSETGEITGAPLTRAAGEGIDVGIRFVKVSQPDGSFIGTFGFKTLTVEPGAVLNVVGKRPIALVARDGISVVGAIDVQGSCMSGQNVAGGGAGGTPKLGAGNLGGGQGGGGGGANAGSSGGGGGGGGYGEAGGAGAGTGALAGAGGVVGARNGDLTQDNPILSGGGGGGAGGGNTATITGGAGGSGGGTVLLASNQGITLGSASIIQASGCGGRPAPLGGGGGGGGAGGAILIEARTITLNNGAILAANGGGGGGGNDGSGGDDGPASAAQAMGGGGGFKGTSGGAGGHQGAIGGAPGATPGGGDLHGGGGGGAVGRIALKSKSGSVTTTGAVLSPAIGDKIGANPSPATISLARFR